MLIKPLKNKPFPRHVIKTVGNGRNELICAVVGVIALVFLLAWMQSDDADHQAVDQSYSEETRKDMKAQSDAQKTAAKWDELQAESNTVSGYAGVMK